EVDETFRINSVSTNDFTVALNIDINIGEILIGALLGLSLARAAARKAIDALKSPNLEALPPNILEQAMTWAKDSLKGEIVKLAHSLADLCPDAVDRAKLEQQLGPVISALEYLEKNVEKGFNMDVRVGPSSTAPEVDDEQENAERIRLEELK